MLRWSGVSGPEILLISSLAKGFGAPLASLCGSNTLIESFKDASETRTHCSPPSNAAVAAAASALRSNIKEGDLRRRHLARLVENFRQRITGLGLPLVPGLFPQQTILPAPGLDMYALHRWLNDHGIRTVLQRRNRQPAVSLLFTAGHGWDDLRRLDRALSTLPLPRRGKEVFHHAVQNG